MTLKEGIITEGRHIKEDANLNLFYVKVMPDMNEIQETDLFPEYPNFFTSNNTAYQPNDVVWIICSDDYHSGYILGLKQPIGGEGITSMLQLINSFEKECGLPASAYDQITISRCSDECITFSNRQTEIVGHVYSNKVLILITSTGTIFVKNPLTSITISDSGNITITGKDVSETLTSKTESIVGASSETSGSKSIVSTGKIKIQASGDLNESTSSNHGLMVGGEENHMVGKKLKETIGLGVERKIVAGGESTTIVAGEYKIDVLAGGISINSGVGTISLQAGLAISINSSVAININAPIIKMPTGFVAPTGSGPFCGLPFCLFSGVSHTGNIMTS